MLIRTETTCCKERLLNFSDCFMGYIFGKMLYTLYILRQGNYIKEISTVDACLIQQYNNNRYTHYNQNSLETSTFVCKHIAIIIKNLIIIIRPTNYN